MNEIQGVLVNQNFEISHQKQFQREKENRKDQKWQIKLKKLASATACFRWQKTEHGSCSSRSYYFYSKLKVGGVIVEKTEPIFTLFKYVDVRGAQIFGSVQLNPSKISEVVDLSINAAIATTIPQDGSVVYTFPREITQMPYKTDEDCFLELTPDPIQVFCEYSFDENDRVQLIASSFEQEIEAPVFLTIRIRGFQSPRSTAPTSSFEIRTFNGQGDLLDYKTVGMLAVAEKFNQIKTIEIESTSDVVGATNAYLNVTFTTLDELLESDMIELTIPKWNREAFRVEPMITKNRQELYCTGIFNAKKNIDCYVEYGRNNDKVTLRRPLQKAVPEDEDGGSDSETADTTESEDETFVDDGVISVGSKITFLVGPIRNPIATGPVSGFFLKTMSYNGGTIAYGQASLAINTEATISNGDDTVNLSVYRSDTTDPVERLVPLINKNSNFVIDIALPVPLNAGCQIDLYIPKPLEIGPDLTKVFVRGLFGNNREAIITLDTDKNLVTVGGACRRYLENATKVTFEIESLVNPGYVITSDSFEVVFTDINGNKIARTSGGLTYTTTPGSIYVQDWFASNRLISSPSEITFSFQPMNPTVSDDTQVRIYMPSDDFEKLPDPCVVLFANQMVRETGWICETDSETNAVIVSNLLKDSYAFEEFSFIVFSIGDIQMPSSSRPTGDYTIEFFDNIDGVYRLVDTVTVTDKLRALPGGLSEVNVEPFNGTTYTVDLMTIEFKLGHTLLQGGYITVELPEELTFVEEVASCVSFSEGIGQESATCSFDFDQGILTLTNGFSEGPYSTIDKGLSIAVDGIFTLRTVRPTSTFKLVTYDANGYAIDTHSTYILPPLEVQNQVSGMRVTQSATEVGKQSVYGFFIRSPYPLYNNDILTLTVPDQAAKVLAQTFVECVGSPAQNYLTSELHSVLIGLNQIKVTLKLVDDLIMIPIGEEFGFEISFLENPESTRPSDPFSVTLTDYNEHLVTTSNAEDALLQNFVMHATTPAQIIFAEVDNKPKYAKEPTLIQMRILTKHTLPMHSQMIIEVPSQLQVPDDLDELKCWVDSSPFGNVECAFNVDDYTFTLADVNPHNSLRGGSEIKIELNGLRNREIAEASDSFTILTLTEDGYLIDEYREGLQVSSNCDWPCWECPVGQPTQCLKCDTRPESLLPLFYNGTCRDDCPSNYFEMGGNKICSQCDEGCLECDTSSLQCVECHFGMYLLGNKCLDVCPETHHGIDESKTCQLCESPCKTCSGSLTHCTSCDQTQLRSLFFDNKCYEECPVDISVFDQGRCVACNPNCKTCDSNYSANYCTSCYEGDYLDFFSNSCVAECPAGISVPKITPGAFLQELTCELCNETCLTCASDNTDICLECRDGLKMLETTKQCLTECPARTAEVWIPLTRDTVCAECAPGCSQCEYSRDHCTVCDPGMVFFDYTCVPECPTGYKLISDEVRTCVRDGEVCPFGQRYNSFGQCELYLAHCRVGYTLNAEQTECIPEPGFHLPFAFLYAALGWTGYIMRKKNRHRMSREQLVSQLLLGYTTFQQLSQLVQLILAYEIDYSMVSGLHTFALFTGCFLNAFCLLAIHLLISDKPFLHWRDQYTRENRIIATVSTIYSFKTTRLLYSNFMGKPYFDAACENRFRSLVRPMFVLTMASLLQTGPILIANVYTIWLLRWGYEIVTLSISSIVLSIVIFALELYEYVLYQRQEPVFMGVKSYFKQQGKKQSRFGSSGKKKAQQIRVMSIMDNGGNNDDDDVGIPYDDNDGSYISVVGMNQSQKELLKRDKDGRPSLRSDQKQKVGVNDDDDQTFQFENFQMGKVKKVDEDRIGFGEQGQAPILTSMIAKLDEHAKIKAIQKELEADHLREMAAIDGTEIPQLDINIEQTEHAVVDKYLDEDIRRKLLVSTTKDKHKQFRAKRQQFEKHRREDRELEQQICHSRLCLSDFEDKHKLDSSTVNPNKKQQKKLKSMLTTVKLPAGPAGHLGCIEKLQDCSDGELERDKLLYDQFYVKFKNEFDEKARAGLLVPNAKPHESFDEDVLREMYDDFGVASDFESELSWISYPPNKGFIREYYENNPVKQAENELFKQKIKVKFQYCNLYKENYDVPEKERLRLKQSRKTQTLAADISQPLQSEQVDQGAQVNIDFDPFESEEEFVFDESEQLSAIDQSVYGNIVNKVIHEGFSDVDSDQISIHQQRIGGGYGNSDRVDTHQGLLSEEIGTFRQIKGNNRTDSKQITKKRKRNDSEMDVAVKLAQLAKTSNESQRVGLNGRATQSNAAEAIPGLLGDVYDTQGRMVYDKDYISQHDDDIPSARLSNKSSNRLSDPGSGHKKGVVSSRSSKLFGEKKASSQRSHPQVVVPSSGRASSSKRVPSSQRNNDEVELQSQAKASSAAQDEPSSQRVQANVDGPFDKMMREDSDVVAQHAPMQQHPQGGFYPDLNGFLEDMEEDERRRKDRYSKRERQMIKAYTSVPASALETDNNTHNAEVAARKTSVKQSRKNSAQGTRKRKRLQQHSPGAAVRRSNRGLSDAQDQIMQEQTSPDNGILQLVISNRDEDQQHLDGQNVNEIDATPPQQLLVNEAKKGDPISEFEGDQDTRGGNLSSSAHEHSSNANLYTGYGTATGFAKSGGPSTSLGGGAQTAAGRTDGALTQMHGNSGIKAHQFLNNTNWESDAVSTGQYFHQQQFKSNGGVGAFQPSSAGNQDSSPDAKNLRTDDEQNLRRLNLNQTEIAQRGPGGGTNVREFDSISPAGVQANQIANWSDDGQSKYHHRGHAEDDLAIVDMGGHRTAQGAAFARLGNSYHYAQSRKMTGQVGGADGPQPFMSLGVTSKPYKARKKRQMEQLLADQRRAKFSMGSDRMHKLENIYIKHGLTANQKNQQLPPRVSSIPRADSVTAETMAVFKRHQAGSNLVQRRAMNASSATAVRPNRRLNGPRLHKQNFVEDGQNIISGAMYRNGSSLQQQQLSRDNLPSDPN